MNTIRVWCEYDINGDLGGNQDEVVFRVVEGLTNDEIESLVLSHILKATQLTEEELGDDEFDWHYYEVPELK